MARKLRVEFEGAVYHVIARGNYRADVFGDEKTKAAFLKCLGEACEKSGWLVHAWCVMSNHYHLCLETPQPNLVAGMKWLQATFSLRFNRYRHERGHLFQGRYKALLVEDSAVGSVCHYIHLNPVRAGLTDVPRLPAWPWTSVHALMQPRVRPAWSCFDVALDQAGALKDVPSDRRRYLEYLAWLYQDDPAKKAMSFDRMSSDWAIGSSAYRKELLQTHRACESAIERGEAGAQAIREELWRESLAKAMRAVRKTPQDALADAKGDPWKVAVAAAMKTHTTASNPWLAQQLHMGSPFRLSRLVSALRRRPQDFEPFSSRMTKCKV